MWPCKTWKWIVRSETNDFFHMYRQWVLTSIRNMWLCRTWKWFVHSETNNFLSYVSQWFWYPFRNICLCKTWKWIFSSETNDFFCQTANDFDITSLYMQQPCLFENFTFATLVIKTTFKRRENDVFTRKRSCEIDV